MIHPRVERQRPTAEPAHLIPWELPPSRSAAKSLEAHPGGPRLGTIVAVAICVAIAAVGWLVAPPAGWIVGVMGLPAATVLSWWMAPSVLDATGRGVLALASELAIGSIVATVALVASVVMLGVVVASAGSMSVAGAGFSLLELVAMIGGGAATWMPIVVVGAMLVSIPLLFIVLPAALAWTFAIRWLARHGWAG